MTNTLNPSPETQVPLPSHVTAEVMDDIGLNMDDELARRERWVTTGECTGPTHIGAITLTDGAIATLQADMTDDFATYLNHGSETEAHLVPDEDDYKTPSPESLAIMNELQTEFEKLVEQDLSQSTERDRLELWHSKMTIGMYQEPGDVHIDRSTGNVDVRYLLTAVGPGTTFFKGEFLPGEFVDGDLAKGFDVPESATAIPQPTGVVLRFLSDCDPHDLPVVDNPVFRILCDVTIRRKTS